ncbi:MAG TPA: hypothetical protein VJM31_19160 [Vicinamibacterales bacterium]|nr:hypothetical protein [Vicinamibacterales bacterium]
MLESADRERSSLFSLDAFLPEVANSTIDPGDVVIDASGSVSATGKGLGDLSGAAGRVGELFRLLMPDAGTPPALRLVAAQALFSPPVYQSLKEFSEALRFFERPNRVDLVRGVYERLTTRVAPAPHAVELPKQAETPKPHAASWRFNRKPIFILVSALCVAALASLGLWFVASRQAQQMGNIDSASVPEVDSGMVSMATSAVDKFVDRMFSSRRPSAVVVSEAAPAPVSPSHSPQRTRQSIQPLTERSDTMSRQPDSVQGGFASEAPSASSVSEQTVADLTTYSEKDADVKPPTAIYPRFSNELPPGMTMDDVAIVDVIVGLSGDVESVKVRRAPSTMGEAMVVVMTSSAAKTWRFSPAVRNGVPVKYRKSVWVLKP